MADEKASPVAEKAKIPLVFHKEHTHSSGPDSTKVYKPGDKDMFTQSEADAIRKLGVARLAN